MNIIIQDSCVCGASIKIETDDQSGKSYLDDAKEKIKEFKLKHKGCGGKKP